jgi:hypothetical protein
MGFASAWDKLLTNPERNSKIFGLLFLFQLIPLVMPLGLPIQYSFYTTDLYKLIEGTSNPEFPGVISYGDTLPGVQPGDLFVWGEACEHAGGWSQARDYWSTVPRWVVGEKGARMIMAWFGYPSISIFEDCITRYLEAGYPELEYGVDYIITEYIPGQEAGMARFAQQIGSLTDARNNRRIDSYPGFTDVVDFNDVDYSYGSVCRTTDHDMFIRQFGTQYPDHHFFLFGEYQIGGAYYGGIVDAVMQYDFEIESIVALKYGRQFLGEQIAGIEARQVGAIVYIPLIIYGLIVNWQRALSEGVSLTPQVGERGQ